MNNNFVSRRGLQRCEDTWRYTNTRYTIIIDNKYDRISHFPKNMTPMGRRKEAKGLQKTCERGVSGNLI